MLAVPWWTLLALLFATWLVATVAVVGRYAVEDARAGVPEGQRRGVSCMPGLPCGPLVLCSVAKVVDLGVGPWGTVLVGGLHVVWLVVSAGAVVRSVALLRRIDKGR